MTSNSLPFADLYHVGPHKTASTSIHRYILPLFDSAEILRATDGPVWGHKVAPVIPQKDVPLLYTNESLIGSIYEPSTKAIKEIKKINPRAKILIVRREKHSWARSLYCLSVKGGEALCFRDFCGKLTSTGKLDIDRTIQDCEDILPGQVTVLPFETVVSDPQAVLGIIADTLNLAEPQIHGDLPRLKQSAGDLTTMAMRLRNSRPTGNIFCEILLTICKIIDQITLRKIRIFRYPN